MPMLLLAVLFLVVPIAELAVIIQVAGTIGIPETIVLLVVISALGAWLCKREGLGVLRRIQARLAEHRLPTRDVADGGLILFAGALLLTPGFLSDVLGILLLLPPTRAVFRTLLLRALAGRVTVVTGAAPFAGGSRYAGSRRRPIDTTGTPDP